MVIRRAFTKTLGAWLNWLPEGDYVTEWTRDRGELGEKKAGEGFALSVRHGPSSDAEDARYVHKLLSDDKFDLIIGSGHGGHHNWLLMFPSGRGYLTAKNGRLTMTAPGVDLPLATSRPKIYWAVGNCLTGVVNTNRNSFRRLARTCPGLDEERDEAVHQARSSPPGTSSSWNMADWFLKQEGRWTFSESLFLLPQWSNYQLAENVVTGRAREGTKFTHEIFVLYGDPALEGRVEKTREPALTETLDIRETGDKDVVRMTYKVKVNFVGEGNKRTIRKYDGWPHLLLPAALPGDRREGGADRLLEGGLAG